MGGRWWCEVRGRGHIGGTGAASASATADAAAVAAAAAATVAACGTPHEARTTPQISKQTWQP